MNKDNEVILIHWVDEIIHRKMGDYVECEHVITDEKRIVHINDVLRFFE